MRLAGQDGLEVGIRDARREGDDDDDGEDGGGEAAAKSDLDFYSLSGQLKGENLKVEDFWDMGPLKAAYSKMGFKK